MKHRDMHEMGDRLLGVDDAARLLGLPISSLYALLAEGRVPRPVKIGRRVRWSQAGLEDWIRKQHQAAQQ
jgi:prophage regulatory protein